MPVGGTFARRRSGQPGPFGTHELHAGAVKLEPHVDGEGYRDEPHQGRGEDVEDPDILVVRRHEPAGEESTFIVVVVGCVNGGVGGHMRLPG